MKWIHNHNRNGWEYVSRVEEQRESIQDCKPDAVIIAAVMEDTLKHVCVTEYRHPIGGYHFGLPAGLMEPGENVFDTAKREFFEETGLEFIPYQATPPNLVSSAGLSDECTQIVFGKARGIPSDRNQEVNEDISVKLVSMSQMKTLLNQPNPFGCVGWGAKAWPIFMAFSNGNLNIYGVKK